MVDPQLVYNKLAQFQTEQELAEFLIEHNCKGNIEEPEHCPIAEYFSREAEVRAFVGETVDIYDKGKTRPSVTFAHTRAMRCFINRFDAGWWPELELQEVNNEAYYC